MTRFAKYDHEGRVLFHGDVPAEMIELQGERVFVGEINGDLQYVVDGAAVLRPRMAASLFNRRLTGLPVPCRITINETVYDCAEPDVTLDFEYPGTYRVTVEAFPYVPMELEIHK